MHKKIKFTIVNWTLDDAADRMVLLNFLQFHWTKKLMVHLNFVVRGILENMARCINSFDIQDNGILFYAAKCVHGHRWYSNRNYNLMPALAE